MPLTTMPDIDEAAALRIFVRLAERWSLTTEQQRTLLGGVASSTYSDWRRRGASRMAPDTLERTSHLLHIDRDLRSIFNPRDDLARSWLRQPNENPLFGGRSALDRMLAGNMEDIITVRRYLDAARLG